MVGEKEINITYETLFEILRTEKARPELQKLSKTFLQDVVSYLNEKKKILEEAKTKTGLFVAEEREKAEMQLSNIRKLLINLYEQREKKIINMALDKSRVNSEIDTSILLEEEKAMFELLVDVLNSQRKDVLFNILEGNLPKKEIEKESKETEKITNEIAETERELQKNNEYEKEEVKKTKLVRFIYAVPRFVGPELETYGPFEEEDMATLPAEIADVLTTKGRAEEINEG